MTHPEVHLSGDARATEEFGLKLAAGLRPGDILLLGGELAAGKTTLVRGLALGLGADPAEVSSPTFVIVQTYPCAGSGPVRRLHHVDLYRLQREQELAEIGLDELFSDPGAVTAVEWPKELIEPHLPPASRVWRLELESLSASTRRIRLQPPRPA